VRRPVRHGALRRLALGARLAPDWAWTAWRGLVGARLRAVEVVQAVVLRDAEVLLALRRDLRGWELPGGNVGPGEAHEAALRREVREETGLEIEVEALAGVYHRRGFLPHTARVYRCRAAAAPVAPSDETPRVAWFRLDALPPLLPWCRQPLADAIVLRAGDPPRERRERLGVREILEAARIDLAARARGE
jgi:8-oxo-dGTP pyrophosphatase MutT (NUDIX family)